MTTDTIPSLWPEFHVDTQPSPLSILRQQGFKLGEMTRNFVYGEVESKQKNPGGGFTHTLYIQAPFLKVRQYSIMLTHSIDQYPVQAVLLNAQGNHVQTENANSATELIAVLKQMFQAEHIVKLVSSLIAQSRDIEDAMES